MLSKLITFTMVFVTLSTHVFAGSQQGIKSAIDELNYSLSVEWDQKDQIFFNNQSEKFTNTLRELQRQGLTNQEMLETVLRELKDKNLKRDIETTFSLVSINKMSPEEAQEQVKQLIQKSYNKGASWNGSSGGYIVLGVVLTIAVAALVVVLFKDQLTKEAEKCYTAYKCHEYCSVTGCNQVCGNECI